MCGLFWQVAHQINLVQFLKASMGLERKCNNYLKGRTSKGKFRGRMMHIAKTNLTNSQFIYQRARLTIVKRNGVSLQSDYGQCSVLTLMIQILADILEFRLCASFSSPEPLIGD